MKSIIIILFFSTIFIVSIISLKQVMFSTAPDFSVFYYSAYALIRGVNPYQIRELFTTFIYPPFAIIPFLPFLAVPYNLAQGFFLGISYFSVFIIVYVSVLIALRKFSLSHFLLFSGLFLLSFPTKFTLGMGQNNLLAALCIIAGFYYYMRGQKTLAGLFNGLALVIKPITVFVLLFFLLKKEWRQLSVSMVVILVSVVGTSLFFGVNTYIYYIAKVAPTLLTPVGREVYYNQGAMGFVARMTTDSMIRMMFTVVFDAMILIVLFVISFQKKINKQIQFALFLSAFPLIDTLSWQHHFVFLLFPFIVAATYFIQNKQKNKLIPLMFSYLLVSTNIKNPALFMSSPAFLILSHVFYGGLILFVILAEISREMCGNYFKQNLRYNKKS